MRSPNFYTYAFLQKPEYTLTLPEGNIGELALIHGQAISAVVEPGLALEASQDNDEKVIKMVLAHDRVICELSAQVTVLPLRFGTYFTSEDSLLEHIESHSQEYQNKLHHIQGKSEYTLKLIPRQFAEIPQTTGVSGRNYFLAKKQHFEEQKNFLAAQSQEKSYLINLITEVYQSSATASDGAKSIVQYYGEEVRLHLLINHHDKTALLEQVLVLQEKCPHWDLILGEPLPPYHFV